MKEKTTNDSWLALPSIFVFGVKFLRSISSLNSSHRDALRLPGLDRLDGAEELNADENATVSHVPDQQSLVMTGLYSSIREIDNLHLCDDVPDDDKPGVASQVEESCDVPAKQGGEKIPHDILGTVPLILAAGATVVPVQIDDALTVLYQLMDQFPQQCEKSPHNPDPPPLFSPEEGRPPAPQSVENEPVENVEEGVGVEEVLGHSGMVPVRDV